VSQEHPLLSVVTPAFNEAESLQTLYQRLSRVLGDMLVRWEWILVDDHSSDDTFAVTQQIANQDSRVKCIRLSHNFGSHIALSCGLRHTSGDCVVVLAADLQDPPEILPTLLAQWQAGAQVVWAVRAQQDRKLKTLPFLSRLYYFFMRHVLGMKQMPATGVDFFLLDRRVVEAFYEFEEGNTSVIALITWMGFRQAKILYEKQPRQYGRSGWNLGKKIKLVVDSVTAFSYFPIRLMSLVGFVIALFGFLYAAVVVINGLAGRPPEGWASLMIAVLVIGGVQMLMMGVLGEYLWRTLDEARRRPQYIVEATINLPYLEGQNNHGK
jgi:polyisoprenyl-phosphate glycosyltransferase